PAIDSIPAHASDFVLTRILRQELGFDGLVLGEGGGLGSIVYEGLADNPKDTARLALQAGLDVGISYEPAYLQPLVEAAREGTVPMHLIDRAVRRILKQKFRLGLFETPYVDPAKAVVPSQAPEHKAMALEAAREGIVLLKNEGEILPLKKDLRSIAVIGPNADHVRNQLGDYTSKTVLQDVVTVLEGIKAKVGPSTRVTYVKGCDVLGNDTDEVAQAAAAARGTEAAIVVIGENEWQAPGRKGTDGEGYDSATLELTGRQEELVKAVVETKTPTVVVLIAGRPLAIRWIAEHVPAIVQPWICGQEGGHAVADVLFGDYNPSGRLPITVPRHVGQLPVYYNHKRSRAYWVEKGWGRPYVDMNPLPLYPFGFGLSYTRFEYSNLRFDRARIPSGGEVEASVDIKNVGSRPGAEVVQLYLRDEVTSVSMPVHELKGFEKVVLQPGETKTVKFKLNPEHLSLFDRHLERVVEPGTFEVRIGASSADIRLKGKFEVTG
ncbi:MAG: beta-glucosidase, partial [Acidobacteria bacterium]